MLTQERELKAPSSDTISFCCAAALSSNADTNSWPVPGKELRVQKGRPEKIARWIDTRWPVDVWKHQAREGYVVTLLASSLETDCSSSSRTSGFTMRLSWKCSTCRAHGHYRQQSVVTRGNDSPDIV